MVNCCVPCCNRRSESTDLHFYYFPTDEKKKKQWIDRIRRVNEDKSQWQPTINSRICSWHFTKGKEYGPCRFEWNKESLFQYPSPQKRPRKIKKNDPLLEIEKTTVPLEIVSSSETGDENINVQNKFPSQDSEIYFLKLEINSLKKQLQTAQQFKFACIEDDDLKVSMYTGLHSGDAFKALRNLMSRFTIDYYAGWKVTTLSLEDQLLMTLMKLRMNVPNLDLAQRFNCSMATVSNVTLTWFYALHEVLYKGLMANVPSLVKNQGCMPTSFATFTNCRMILDCTEIYVERPGQMDAQSLTFSNYKNKNTFKGLIGVAPNGVITFASELYCGSVQDKVITAHCEVLHNFMAGDLILADKGFLIRDLLPAGVSLNIPPFLNSASGKFTKEEVIATRTIARARIHVERAIARLKGFKILKCIPQQYRRVASILFQTCCALTNLQCPIIKNI